MKKRGEEKRGEEKNNERTRLWLASETRSPNAARVQGSGVQQTQGIRFIG
jgi:hypothetical protein